MSSIEKAPELKRRIRTKPFQKNWLSNEVNLIHLVSKYPIIYTPVPTSTYRHSKLNKIGWDHAWVEISTKLGEARGTLIQKWRNIKHKYAMIMSLIISEKITKNYAMAHPEAAKFLDGRLNFLDPYLIEICDEKNIPVATQKLINNMFSLKSEVTHSYSLHQNAISITHAQVKNLLSKRKSEENEDSDFIPTKSVQTAVNMAIKCKLDELLIINNTLSHPNIRILYRDGESNDNDAMIPSRNMHKSQPNFTFIPNKDNESKPEDINLGLQSELIIEDNVKMESIDENVMMEDEDDNVINVNVQDNTVNKNVEEAILTMNVEKVINKNDDDFNMKDKDNVRGENSAIDTNVNNKIVEMVDLENTIPSTTIYMSRYTSGELKDVSDEHIRNFFTELGVITSLELNVFKKKILKERINELLKRLLVGDLSLLSDAQFLTKTAKD